MKFFRHDLTSIRMLNGVQEFECTPERFQELEPDYPGLPDGVILRVQTPDMAYLDTGYDRQDDPLNALVYCDRIPTYTAMPSFYACVTLDKTVLCIENDSIQFQAALRVGPADTDPLIPMTASWPIMLRQKNGLAFDNFMADFVNGQCAYSYTYKDGLPLGEWYLDEEDFDLVEYGGQTYAIKLAQPVHFTVYRRLA